MSIVQISAHCIELLSQLNEFVEVLPVELYSASSEHVGLSSIGKHTRHCLDHFDRLRSGLRHGIIDYDLRPRDEATEQDPKVAIHRIDETCGWISDLAPARHSLFQVRAMISTDPDLEAFVSSTLERELLFVANHLVHHMGMLRVIAKLRGVPIDEDFGRAVSTQAYLHKRKA
jgi:hypothetical protein